jgi:endonuclease/exonuclease/phosphatase family metal-dependent hydrolase
MTFRHIRHAIVGASVMGLLVGVSLPLRADAHEKSAHLRVLTYNVLHDGAWSGFFDGGTRLPERLAMTIEEFQRLRPDIIALQEASDSRRHGNVPQRIADALGYHMVFAPATERVFRFRPLDWLVMAIMGFREGPAILSRFPITASDVYELPRCRHRLEPRVMLRAEIAAPGGPVQIFSVHTARGDECQIQRVGELFREHRGDGRADFNTGDQSPIVARWLERPHFIDAFRAANPDAPGFTVWQQIHVERSTATRRVDFIFLMDDGANGGPVVHASRLALDHPGRLSDGSILWPSDHRGVFAELDVVSDRNLSAQAGNRY